MLTLAADSAHRIEGIPRLTISLPAMLQTYDHGLNFELFSPARYFEVGPMAQLAYAPWRHWQLAAHARLGGQRESLRSWQAMVSTGGSLERELSRRWALRGNAGWTTSSVASPTGFRRTAADLSISFRP